MNRLVDLPNVLDENILHITNKILHYVSWVELIQPYLQFWTKNYIFNPQMTPSSNL